MEAKYEEMMTELEKHYEVDLCPIVGGQIHLELLDPSTGESLYSFLSSVVEECIRNAFERHLKHVQKKKLDP